jgi:3-hydroxybutyrate dehydrogenase
MADGRFLAGRTALVTGGARGLGAAMVRGLAAAGANVIVCDVADAPACERTRAQIEEESGVAVPFLRADLADPRQVAAMLDEALGRLSPVGILVNNAVVRHFAPIADFPLEEWDRALAVNLTAAFVATKRLLPVMLESGYGRVFNMTSVFGHRATVNRVDYVTTKTALQGFTRAVALEVAGTPVTCHALMPGSVQTAGIQARIDELKERTGVDSRQAERDFLEGKQPSGRFVEPASVVEVMLMLCGPVGLDMNGAVLPIEAGWLARS